MWWAEPHAIQRQLAIAFDAKIASVEAYLVIGTGLVLKLSIDTILNGDNTPD